MNLIRLLLQTSVIHLAVAVMAGILSGASAAGLIALINTTLTQNSTSTAIVWTFAALCLLRLATNLTSQVLLIRLSQTAILDLRMRMSRRILASPLSQLENIGAPRLLAVLTEDIQAISNTAFVIPFFCINFAIVIGCLVYLCWLSWSVFLIAACFMFLGICTYQLPIVKSRSFLKLAREQEDRLYDHFRAITEGTKELKLHQQRRQAFFSEALYTTARSHRHYNVLGMSIFAAAASWGQILFFLAIGLILFVLPTLTSLNTVVVIGYALTIIYLMTPLEYIMSMLLPLSKATVALQKIESLGLSLTSYYPECANTLTQLPAWECLKLVGVTHTYYQEREDTHFILGPIDLKIYAGELLFIIGGNGSGKSTLIKLITGLYPPDTGEIYLDDKRISDREDYRQQFSAIFSDFYLFERFLGIENLHINTQTHNYLVQLQLDHKVHIEDGILSTTALSQGQRKRLALLTAYLEDRPFYVFDEWASDQDPLFKKIFYTQLLPELKKKGKTVIVISHDDQYFGIADRIVKLEYGSLKFYKKPHNVTISG
ncbi:cyclic peptide transporter [Gloeocapsa sp. PCC 7428]|uniref:cyclic peptide export ABC transporter n=1 Tax=Gloeocapsa sp. PCC 7428 TaxID=1173026 RepID=UPI0002A5C819|nr:cyclic peptide export ABC transporter [Gloeocapsa sp. PCC 7428]AFZ30071.1 cyclic peptide transporter [Gloeocapsa sp. PCC 7428]